MASASIPRGTYSNTPLADDLNYPDGSGATILDSKDDGAKGTTYTIIDNDKAYRFNAVAPEGYSLEAGSKGLREVFKAGDGASSPPGAIYPWSLAEKPEFEIPIPSTAGPTEHETAVPGYDQVMPINFFGAENAGAVYNYRTYPFEVSYKQAGPRNTLVGHAYVESSANSPGGTPPNLSVKLISGSRSPRLVITDGDKSDVVLLKPWMDSLSKNTASSIHVPDAGDALNETRYEGQTLVEGVSILMLTVVELGMGSEPVLPGGGIRGPRISLDPAAENNIVNLTERGTLTNLRPADPVFLQNRARTLVQDESGRFWLQGADGKRITPTGKYDFVTMPNGTIRVARSNSDPEFSTHLGLSGGNEVSYAGSVQFSNGSTTARGSIRSWSNDSGHYQPPASLAGNAGLPLDLFKTY